MASPCGSWISGFSITSTTTLATREGYGTAAASACAACPARGGYCHTEQDGQPAARSAGPKPPQNPGPGRRGSRKEWHVTVNDAGRAPSLDDQDQLIQLLTPEGERVENPEYPLEITADQIKGLYRDMVIVRRIDTEAIALQRQGELGIWASLLGQEAAQVGSGRGPGGGG